MAILKLYSVFLLLINREILMEISARNEQVVPKQFLNQVRDQLDSIDGLLTNMSLVLGKSNIHAKRLAVLKLEFESLYSAMSKSQVAAVAEEEDEDDDTDVVVLPRSRKVGGKSSARLNTHQLDNINYYIRHLQSEQDVYLLYEFFDLIVAKVKEHGAYDAQQIWGSIKSEAGLLNNKAAARNMRDILDNHELQEGLSLYATLLREKQALQAG